MNRYDALLLWMVTVVGINIPAVKWAITKIDPVLFNAIRFPLATVAMLVICVLTRQTLKLRPGDLWKLVGLGLLGHSCYQLGFIFAMARTLAGNMAILLAMSPVFVAIFSAVLGFERISRRAWLGIALALCGSTTVILSANRTTQLGASLAGDLTALAIAAAWALYVVLSRPLLHHYPAVKLNALTMLFGSIPILLVSLPTLLHTPAPPREIPLAAWGVLVGSGFFAITFAYIVWSLGIHRLGPTRTAAYFNLVPVIAALIAMRLLHEPIGLSTWAGLGLLLLGMYIVRRGRMQPAVPALDRRTGR